MNNKFRVTILLSGLLMMPSAFPAEAAAEKRPRTLEPQNPSNLTVSGHGEVAEPPDRATVRLGAEAQAPDAAAAQSAVNATMQKALKQIQKAGVPERSIRTTGLNLYPVYAPREPGREAEPPRVVAYRASNTIQIQVDDLQLVGKVIDAGLAAGVNRLEGVSFELQDDLSHRTRALTMAVQEAKAKAQAMAKALDVHLTGVMDVTEGGVTVIPRQESFDGARMMTAATPVQPGEVRVQASVTVRYAIREEMTKNKRASAKYNAKPGGKTKKT